MLHSSSDRSGSISTFPIQARRSTTMPQALSAWRLAIFPNPFCSALAENACPQLLVSAPISGGHQTIKAISRCQLCARRYPTTSSESIDRGDLLSLHVGGHARRHRSLACQYTYSETILPAESVPNSPKGRPSPSCQSTQRGLLTPSLDWS